MKFVPVFAIVRSSNHPLYTTYTQCNILILDDYGFDCIYQVHFFVLISSSFLNTLSGLDSLCSLRYSSGSNMYSGPSRGGISAGLIVTSNKKDACGSLCPIAKIPLFADSGTWINPCTFEKAFSVACSM